MGGKNAAIVYSDCDLELTVKTLVRSSFINQGEVCLCTSRIFVQQEAYAQFLEKFVEATKYVRIERCILPLVSTVLSFCF